MSRIGKKVINIPQGVKVTFTQGKLSVEGPKGKLALDVDPRVTLEVSGNEAQCQLVDPNASGASEVHGLVRSLISNMIQGCATGFTKELEVVGTGYRANVKGKELELSLGFSHPVVYPIPDGITMAVDKLTKIVITGADKRLVGQTAAEIRRYRQPEPYKGKGVKYTNETIVRKAGKAAGAGK